MSHHLESQNKEKIYKASDLFLWSLEAEGVEHIFAVPSEENLDMQESLRTLSINFILTSHEQRAAFLAATQVPFITNAGLLKNPTKPIATTGDRKSDGYSTQVVKQDVSAR